jgi:hypothetical protein
VSRARAHQPIASNLTKETPRMTSLDRRRARRNLHATALIAAVLGILVFAAPASAAPSFGITLSHTANEVQRVAVNASEGQFKISFGADTTADLAVNSTPAQVQAALNGLPSINAGGGSVSVDPRPLGGSAGVEYFVTFDGGPLANTDVPQMTAASGTVPLTGLASRVSVWTVDPAGVSHSDRRIDYLVNVSNAAPAAPLVAGDTLKCSPDAWTGVGAPAFTFQWLRNGTPIGGATASSYTTVAPADQGAVIQCRVIATNTIADASNATDFVGSTRVSAGVIVNPQPLTAPPTPPTTIGVPAQTGALDGTATRELTCNAGGWGNAPESFTYQWYRNGVALGAPIGPTAATTTKLTLTAAEQSPPAAFQCAVAGTNAGGSQAKVSGNRITASSLEPNPAAPNNNNTLFVSTPNETSGPVNVEVALPGGLETFVLKTEGTGWACSAQPAAAICSRSDKLAPGASYPVLAVSAAPGPDAPDHALATATVSGGGGATAAATDEFDFTPARVFEISKFDAAVSDSAGSDYTQAGGHPFAASASFQFPRYRSRADLSFLGLNSPANYRLNPIEHARRVITDLPRGFVGNALAVPQLCPGLAQVLNSTCPAGSVVGGITLDLQSFGTGIGPLAIYAIEPEFGKAAQFAFAEGNTHTTYSFSPRLRADDGYAITLEAAPIPTSYPQLYGVENVTLCDFGGNLTPATGMGVSLLNGCKLASNPTANPIPLITNPTRCNGQPPTVKLSVDSWEHPGALKPDGTPDLSDPDWKSKEAVNPAPTGCEKVDFQPEIHLQPTSHHADSPTGLDVEITMPTAGLENRQGQSQANLDNATVTFPKGMSVNPAASHGLGACSPAQVKLGSNDPDECPASSRVGTVEVDTPLIRETLTGNVYLASQRDNPFNSTIGIYLVFSSKKDGIIIKVAGKLQPDPATGQLTSSFVENPEAPFSKLVLHFNSGDRAPLINPPRCGSYAIHSELSPWSAASPANPTAEEIVAADSTYQVTSGPNGGPCPSGGLDPKLDAGLKNATAGSKSPFVLKLSREDGSQRFTGLDVSMPKGLTAYLKGVPYCPDNVLAGISGEELTGQAELANPACPAASQVGTVQAGAGAGPFPFYAPGRAFLAGPYKGAPLSIAIVTPAVAGPFDLGNVVVRNALLIDPVTSQVTVMSDPIPTMLHGLLLDVRDIRVNIDRQGFTAAPTNCEPSSIGVRVRGELGAIANLSDHFQVGDCAALGFEPKLALRLFGGTHRGAHPRLRATLTARPGDANIAGASVALPHSEFLDQAHIRTVCTRVQFAADACPDAAIYGHAEAITPLLDAPLSGPVYLRSSSNPLPDLVAALRGPDAQPIEVVLDGRVDSVHGGIRTTFEVVPDQPVSTFTLNMQGGKKGLLVNSRDICKSMNKANAVFTAQNGRTTTLRPVLQSSCGKAAKKHKRHR